MFDYSNMLNVSGNQQRGTQQPTNAFSGLGSAPMNIMPQNPGQQPGMNLQGMMSFLGNAFSGQPQGLLPVSSNTNTGNLPAGSIGSSLYQLGQIFNSARRTPQPPAAPPWAANVGFGAPFQPPQSARRYGGPR